ncbi:Hypothetical_protein [Hexamita inflata]|uniref:Hypothetical_protein n=1 Tax=Hexamita inflata TaxID=28002 RepID=A0AA86Q334_9EUKA|nr:Hypothetical protein HINF_LOCUS32250 [Hexamita inflata]CAI9951285.1 Hypothetical protein HINF_LOCUS38930 [Hexamita inflata]
MNANMWSTIKDGMNDTADKLIDKTVSDDFRPVAKQTVDTLNSLGKIKEDYRTLNDQMKILPSGSLNNTTKKKTGWQKFKNVMSNIWTVVKKPVTGLIEALPGGKLITQGASAVSGLFNRFKNKNQSLKDE